MKHGTLSAYRSGCHCDRCVAHVVRRCAGCGGTVMLTGRGRPPKYCLRCEPEKQRLDPAQKVTLACECGHEVHQVSHLAEHTRSRPGKTPWRGTKRTDRCAGRQ